MTREEEAAAVDAWKLDRYAELGFDENASVLLLLWDTDPHEAERLMRRDGKPTDCSIVTALRILRPLDEVRDRVVDPELYSVKV